MTSSETLRLFQIDLCPRVLEADRDESLAASLDASRLLNLLAETLALLSGLLVPILQLTVRGARRTHDNPPRSVLTNPEYHPTYSSLGSHVEAVVEARPEGVAAEVDYSLGQSGCRSGAYF